MKGITVGPSVDPVVIARGTPGLSGADLANLINQAAIRAATLHAPAVELSHLEWAKDKIQMGAERHSAVITQESKRLTAYHEGGHALVALYTQAAMPLHKVTVIPRGSALGLTVQLPENDILTHTRAELLARLDVCMGGRVAEELIYGPLSVTTGASSDLQSATMTARQMVMAYGMSDNAGLVQFDAQSFADASPATKSLIEVETSLLLAVCIF